MTHKYARRSKDSTGRVNIKKYSIALHCARALEIVVSLSFSL
jgi:hypothetical protein